MVSAVTVGVLGGWTPHYLPAVSDPLYTGGILPKCKNAKTICNLENTCNQIKSKHLIHATMPTEAMDRQTDRTNKQRKYSND